jgi:hypothetical protein
LLLVPVAGVRERDLRPVGDARFLKLGLGRVDHRLEVAEVG